MTSFPLKIVTADGLIYNGNAEMVIVRTITGDMAFLARHINCVAPLAWVAPLLSLMAKSATLPASAA